MGPVAITCFSGGRVNTRVSSQRGSVPGPRQSMRASDAVVKERVRRTGARHAEVGPVAIRCFSGGRVSAHASMLARDPRRARCERCPWVKRLSKSVATGVPRSSILAQLGGVACPPARGC